MHDVFADDTRTVAARVCDQPNPGELAVEGDARDPRHVDSMCRDQGFLIATCDQAHSVRKQEHVRQAGRRGIASGLVVERMWTRDDLEVTLAAEHDRIAEVAMTIRSFQYDKRAEVALRARWGRPEIEKGEYETWTWNRDDRTITVELGYPTKIAIRKRRTV
jgi:hypothetical protein